MEGLLIGSPTGEMVWLVLQAIIVILVCRNK